MIYVMTTERSHYSRPRHSGRLTGIDGKPKFICDAIGQMKALEYTQVPQMRKILPHLRRSASFDESVAYITVADEFRVGCCRPVP